ncbi:MAG: nitroreductase family protein [Mobilitalea sp.]
MKEILDIIRTRRSIRSYSEEQIPDMKLNEILEAAIHAPSGSNSQTWLFTVLQNTEILKTLNEYVRNAFMKFEVNENTYRSIVGGKKASINPNYNFYYDAPTLIIASNDNSYPNAIADCAAALQNILLTAHSLDLGACWINQLTWFGNEPEIRELLTEVGIPRNHMVCCSAAVGFPSGNIPKLPPRKEGTIHIIK